MNEPNSKSMFQDFEPTAFPDLTGRSSMGKKLLQGHGKATAKLRVRLDDLNTSATALQISLEVLFSAAWAKVLVNFQNEADIAFGLADRQYALSSHTEPAVSMKPLRAQIRTSDTNSVLVADLNRQLGYEHVHRNNGDSPVLFDTCVQYLGNASEIDSALSNDLLSTHAMILRIYSIQDAQNFQVSLHFRRSLLLDEDTHHVISAFTDAIQSIIEQPRALAVSMLPQNPLSTTSILDQSCDKLSSDHGITIIDSLIHHCERQPDSPALDFLEADGTRTVWSYQKLYDLGSRIAEVLVANFDVALEDSVPICVSKSAAFYASILGVMIAGAVFTPFSNAPQDRKVLMLEELGSKVVIHVDDEDMSWCHNTKLFNISTLMQKGHQKSKGGLSPRPHVAANNLIYQMYTSGSTGRPKAVSLEHGNVIGTVVASKSLVPWNQQSRMLQYAAPSFDMCYYDTFLAWYLGICLCSASDSAVYNDLPNVINTLQVSMLGLTPSVALTLDPETVPGIEWMYCIGEAMPQSLVEAWHGRLVNSYGPTEAAQMITIYPVAEEVKSAVIGQPFPSTSAHVRRSDTNEAVPIFGIGELCIGGQQVARGYFANETKTKESFVYRNGKRLYKTGDNVRMLGNGMLEFIGRSDDQVKIRGQRVELGEVNKAIEEARSEVDRASSQILKISDTSKEQLVSFVALRTKRDAGENEIRETISSNLRSSLPSYMVPKLILFIDKIPLSAAGKVDKRALKDFMRRHSLPDNEQSAEVTNVDLSPAQEQIRSVFARFARINAVDVGLDASIYRLGMDSISAIQMASFLKRDGASIDASDILNHPSVRQLAQLLDIRRQSPSESTYETPMFDFATFDKTYRRMVVQACRINESSIAALRPATALQSGMLSQSIHSSGSLYFNHMLYTIPENADRATLMGAWNSVAAKYEILRTGFAHIEDRKHPFAMITYHHDQLELPITHQDSNTAITASECHTAGQHAVDNLHLPPWRVILQPTQMHILAHHALYDAESLELILRDLENAFNRSILHPAPSFEEYMQQTLAAADQKSSSAKFWTSIGEKTFVTRLPVLTPLRVEDPEFGELRMTCTFSRQTLESSCRNLGITLQVAAQAAWGRLLSAYTGEHEITFGTVLSGRTTADAETIGFPCITTVPTPVHAGKDKSELLKDLMTFNAEMQRHQFVPLKEIERLTGHPNEALFDTIFTYQKRSATASVDSMFEFVENDLTIDYPLSMELEPIGNDRLDVRLYYRIDRLPHEQAQLMAEQYDTLLCETLSENRDWCPPLMNEASERLYSITSPEFPHLEHEAQTLHDFVAVTTRSTPQATALEFVHDIPDVGDVKRDLWTYEQLEAESNRIANLLVEQGVEQASIVAVCFDKCPEAAFTMLAVSKLGCSFLALDAGAPLERKKFIMQDSKATALVFKGTVVTGLENRIDVPVIDLGQIDISTYSESDPVLKRPIDPQDLSYCLYTSGTTGTPKGCAITHENVVQAFLSFHKLYRWNDKSRWLQFASYHFDVSVMEHFWSWSVGMTVVVANRDLVFADLAGTIQKLEITHTDLTPSLARLLDPEDIPSLAGGVFVTGGEMLRQEVIDKFGPHGAIHNAYGPTEATIGCTMYPSVPMDGKPSNIGWHFPVAGSFIVNPQDPMQPVLRGAVGEFVVSGKLVAKEYIGRPDLTKQKFITITGQRCYRTGDLVRILHNNTFDFVGRADDQVKLRGQRLEIGEINSVIKTRSDLVLDVTTLVLKHPKQQKEQLITFVVESKTNSKGHGPSQVLIHDPPRDLLADLKRACQEKLPQYMVPTHILPVNKLPLSANNKADAKQLKALYEQTSVETLQDLAHTDKSPVSAETSVEQDKIVQVLSKLLDLPADQISGDSSFFELGLDSITVIGFVKMIRGNGLLNATAAIAMKNSTPARLAQALASNPSEESQTGSVQAAKQKILACQHQHTGAVAATLSVPQAYIEAVAPCTPLQQGIISRALKSGNTLYYGGFDFFLNTDIQLERLRQAFQAVFNHVQILRTKFIPTDDGYVQAVLRDLELPWIETSAQYSSIDRHLQDLQDAWRKRNTEIIDRPVELVLTRSADKMILSLHIFHACYDGNSLPLLLQSVLAEYNVDKDFEYGVPFHNALAHGPLREPIGAERFWKEHLRDAAHSSPQTLSPLTIEPSNTAISVSYSFDEISGFEECRRQLNVTPQALLQACWGIVLQTEVSRPLVQGFVVSGRSLDLEGADSIVGPLFNTIPFLMQLRQDDSWRDVVQKCHNFNTAALEFQHTPLRNIQKWISPRRTETTLFEHLFVFQKATDDLKYPAIWSPRDQHFEADYPLALEILQTKSNCFELTMVTQAGISSHSESTRILERLRNVLNQLIADPEAELSKLMDVPEALLFSSASKSSNGNATQDAGENESENARLSGQSAKVNGHQWTPQMSRLREEISRLAGVASADVSPDTSILELGLDSVDAVKLSARMKRLTGVGISVSSIMRLLTVERIASQNLQGKQTSRENRQDRGFETLKGQLNYYAQQQGLLSTETEAILPSTPLQEGMVADMLKSDLRAYFNHDVLKVKPNVTFEHLQQAWQMVVNMTPILRTRFVEVDDPSIECTIVQVIQRPKPVSWRNISLDGNAEFSSAFEDIRLEAAQNIKTQPLFRLTLLKHASEPDSRYVVLSLSHAMYDGWSLGLLHSDVHAAHTQYFKPRPSYEPILHKITSSVNEESQAYWREALHATSQSTFPPRRALRAPTDQTHRMEILCQQSSDAIQNFCKAQRTTVAAFSQTIWSFVLASRLKQLDVAFATVLSGRDDEEANDVLFPIMNTVIARSVIHGSRADMMHYTQNNLSSVSEHQHFPLRKALALAKGKDHGELTNSLFIYQKRPETDAASDPLYTSVIGSADEGIPVAVEAELGDGVFVWRIATKEGYLNKESTQSVLEDLKFVTSEVIERPNDDSCGFKGAEVVVCGLRPFRSAPTSARSDDTESNSLQSNNDTPLTDIESQVQSVVAIVARLDKSEVRRSSSLLSLGLDSISAIKVCALLRKNDVSITVNELLKAETIGNIATHIIQLANNKESRHVESLTGIEHDSQYLRKLIDEVRSEVLQKSGIPAEQIAKILPATSGQALMLSKWQNQGLYLPTLEFTIEGIKDANSVCQAWKRLVANTPILRTAFVATPNKTVPIAQLVLNSPEAFARVVSASENLTSAVNSFAAERKSIEQVTPAVLFVQPADGTKISVMLKLSHALYDAYSVKLIIHSLQEALRTQIPALVGSKTYEAHLARAAMDARGRQTYWSAYLANLKCRRLPRIRDISSRQLHIVKPDAVPQVSSLHRFVRQKGITVQAIFLAAYAKLYGQLAGAGKDDDILLGAYVANRNFEGADEVHAPTLGFVPLRVKGASSNDLLHVSKQLQRDLRDVAQDTRGSVSIQELTQWLGEEFAVDTWVNLILEDDSTASANDQPSITFGEDRRTIDEAFDINTNTENRAHGLFLKGNRVRNLYQDSIDIDGTISPNSMDIGVIAPDGLADAARIKDIMNGIVTTLKDICAKQ